MNEEELREYILKLEKEKEELINNNENLQMLKEDSQKEIEQLNEEVRNLKLKNYELFTQISHQVETVENKKDETNVLSLRELTNKLIKGE